MTIEEKNETSYKIGQTLYVLKNMQIEPCYVVEEVVKTTLQGSKKSWIVEFVDSKRLDVSLITDEIFTNPEKLRKLLISRATIAITNMVNAATNKSNEIVALRASKETFAEPNEQEIERLQPVTSIRHDNSNEQIVRVKLPDGKIANMKI